jgi:hypothetical protein
MKDKENCAPDLPTSLNYNERQFRLNVRPMPEREKVPKNCEPWGINIR